jgi:hypothetical protein
MFVSVDGIVIVKDPSSTGSSLSVTVTAGESSNISSGSSASGLALPVA